VSEAEWRVEFERLGEVQVQVADAFHRAALGADPAEVSIALRMALSMEASNARRSEFPVWRPNSAAAQARNRIWPMSLSD
jgi:hypothetical protein